MTTATTNISMILQSMDGVSHIQPANLHMDVPQLLFPTTTGRTREEHDRQEDKRKIPSRCWYCSSFLLVRMLLAQAAFIPYTCNLNINYNGVVALLFATVASSSLSYWTVSALTTPLVTTVRQRPSSMHVQLKGSRPSFPTAKGTRTVQVFMTLPSQEQELDYLKTELTAYLVRRQELGADEAAKK